MTFWDIRKRPIDQLAEDCSLAGFGMDPIKWSALSKGTKFTQSKWIALDTGLILQDLAQAKEGPTQTHPSRFGLDGQTWKKTRRDNNLQVQLSLFQVKNEQYQYQHPQRER